MSLKHTLPALWLPPVAGVCLIAMPFVATFALSAGSEVPWDLPKADSVAQVARFPALYFFHAEVSLDVPKSVIETFLREGQAVPGDRRGEVYDLAPLTEKSGKLVGRAEAIAKVLAGAVGNPLGLEGYIDAHGVILMKNGDIFFYEFLNDRVLTLYRDEGDNGDIERDRVFLVLK